MAFEGNRWAWRAESMAGREERIEHAPESGPAGRVGLGGWRDGQPPTVSPSAVVGDLDGDGTRGQDDAARDGKWPPAMRGDGEGVSDPVKQACVGAAWVGEPVGKRSCRRRCGGDRHSGGAPY